MIGSQTPIRRCLLSVELNYYFRCKINGQGLVSYLINLGNSCEFVEGLHNIIVVPTVTCVNQLLEG